MTTATSKQADRRLHVHAPGNAKRVLPQHSLSFLSSFNFFFGCALGVLGPVEVLFLARFVESVAVRSILVSIPWLLMLLAAPLTTTLAGKYGQKKSILYLSLASLPFLVALPFTPSFWWYAFCKVGATLFFLSWPVSFTYVPKVTKRLGFGFGALIVATSVGGAVGALASGFVAELFGLQASFVLLPASVVLALLCLTPLREAYYEVGARKKVRWNSWLVGVFTLNFFASFHLSARVVAWPLVASAIVVTPAGYVGAVFAGMGLVAALLSLPAGHWSDRHSPRSLWLAGWFVMLFFGLALYFVTDSPFWFFALSLAFAVGESVKGPAASAIIGALDKPGLFGLLFSVGALGALLGTLLSGVSVDVVGANRTVLLLGLLVALPFFVFIPFWARSKSAQ